MSRVGSRGMLPWPPEVPVRASPLLIAVLAVTACNDGGPAGNDKEPPPPTDTLTTDTEVPPATGDTGDTTAPTTTAPSLLTVACAGTDNALRFECTVAVEPAQPVQLVFART